MPEYLLSARDPKGHKVTECVEACSTEDAVAILREQGYTEIVLHTDEAMAAVTPKQPLSEHITPRDLVELRLAQGYFARFYYMLRKLNAIGWKSTVLLLAVVLAFALWHRSWGLLAWLGLAAILFPVPLALVFALFPGSRRYDRVVEAACWGRWEEVLHLLPHMPRQVPRSERVLRQAQAFAGLGRLGEGLALFEPFATNGDIPEWLYWARVAEIYGAARDLGEALKCREKALRLAPDNPTILIDVATSIVRLNRDVRRASNLLDRAKRYSLSDLAGPFLQTAEAIVTLESGDAEGASRELEATLRQCIRLVGGNPVGRVAIDRIHVYLAIAYAHSGNSKLARTHFRQAEPRMRALGWDDLLQRCEHALG
jgi:hypothetical protein